MEANYEVWLRDKRTGNRRSIILWATSFADAEALVGDGKLTAQYYNIKDEEIIRIDKEYETDTFDERKRMEFLLTLEPE